MEAVYDSQRGLVRPEGLFRRVQFPVRCMICKRAFDSDSDIALEIQSKYDFEG